MTTITITDKYKIEVDQYNYTLMEIIPYTSKNGEDKERDKLCGYYPTLQNALVALSHLMTVEEQETYTLSEYITQSIESSKTVRNSLELKVEEVEKKNDK